MRDLPFTLYDFFAHLSAGFVTLILGVFVVAPGRVVGPNPSVLEWVLLAIVAYVLGHVIAQFASVFLEHAITRRLLGSPEDLLFRERRPRHAFLFPGYYRPLPPELRRRILDRAAEKSGILVAGQALFMHARWRVWNNPAAVDRLSQFLNLYGFARNMCFASLIVGVTLIISRLGGTSAVPRWTVVLPFGIAATLFYRFLKFYRLYAVEVLMAYAEMKGEG